MVFYGRLEIYFIMEKIYVKLMNEGSVAYRPIPSSKVSDNIYKLMGSDIYDIEDETWEFLPGTLVLTEKKELGGKLVLVAVEEILDMAKSRR